MSAIGRILVDKEGNPGVLVEKEGFIIFKTIHDSIKVARVPHGDEKESCEQKVREFIEFKKGLAKSTKVKSEKMAMLAEACRAPREINRDVRIGDVVCVEGQTTGILCSIEPSELYDNAICYHIFNRYGMMDALPINTIVIRHATIEQVTEIEPYAKSQIDRYIELNRMHQDIVDLWESAL